MGMMGTYHRIVDVPDPTPFTIRGQDLQATDWLAPEDRHAANVCDGTCLWSSLMVTRTTNLRDP